MAAKKKPASHTPIGTSPGHRVILVNGVPTIVVTAKAKPKGKTPVTGTEPAINRSHATLMAFDSGAYLATIQLTRSPGTSISAVPVSRGIASGAMQPGHVVAVIFFDSHNSADSMIVGVS
jgi:hypothetical protein